MEHSAQIDKLPNLAQSPLFDKVKHPAFRRIGVMGRPGKKSVIKTIYDISDRISQMGLTLIIDSETANFEDLRLDRLSQLQIVKRSLLGEVCDLVIVVGGDGSILQAAQALARYRVPVLGVNRGRLGFLTDVNPDEVGKKLHQVLLGDYQLDQRFMLMMEIREGEEIIHQGMALNDVVLHAGKSVHMIDFQLTIDGLDVYRQHSDGLIVATSTGSTAYALSGGGPIIHPSLHAICLVPMHPHTLSSRPIVIGYNSEIMIRIHRDNRTQPMVSVDGHPSIPIEQNQRLYIRKHPDKLTLIHPPGFDFYKACRTKLNWSVHSEELAKDKNGRYSEDED